MWDASTQSHFDANLPVIIDYAIHAYVRRYSDGVQVAKGVWTGREDLSITLDSVARVYEGAMGGLQIGPIRYRTGTIIQIQRAELPLSPEGVDMVKGHNTRNAPVDLFCLISNPATMGLVGTRRMFKGTIVKARIAYDVQQGVDKIMIDMASLAQKGEMTVVGKKSDVSQKERSATDDAYEYADLGMVGADPWGVQD
jgi:hypothetical protein